MSITTRSSMDNPGNNMWSKDLLKEIIEEIGKWVIRLSIADAVRMGAVCRSWRSAASECLRELRTTTKPSKLTINQEFVPWIMESHSCPSSTQVRCSLYIPQNNKKYNNLNKFAPFPPPALDPEDELDIISSSSHRQQLPQHQGIQCLGSIEEWLMVVEQTWPPQCKSPTIESAKVRFYFFNPVTGDYIMLPHQSTIPFVSCQRSYLVKMVASSVPTITTTAEAAATTIINPNCIVAAIAADSHTLFFCRPTDEKWACHKIDHHIAAGICELLFHEDGKLYAMGENSSRCVHVFDPLEILSVRSDPKKIHKQCFVQLPKEILDKLDDYWRGTPSLFVSSKGRNIILFWRNTKAKMFLVLKLKFDEPNHHPAEWEKVGSHDLQDEIVFVSHGSNMSIPKPELTMSSTSNSSLESLQGVVGGGNCICFPGEDSDKKIVVYDVGNERAVKYPASHRAGGCLKAGRIRVWFTPKPALKDYY